jgi:hypothetical protein
VSWQERREKKRKRGKEEKRKRGREEERGSECPYA